MVLGTLVENWKKAGEGERFTWNYIRNPSYDWAFFLAPFWVSAVYFLAISVFPLHEMTIYLVSYVVLTETHFASTWLTFLDPENRQHYSASKWTYYYVPALIIIACGAISYWLSLRVIVFVAVLLSFGHVVRQNTGFVALYRSKTGDCNPKSRFHENWAIYSASMAFFSVGVMRFYVNSFDATYSRLIETGAITVGCIAAASAAYFVFRISQTEWQKFNAGKAISLSQNIVLTYSMLLYLPYAFASRIEHALAMSLGIHYVQYLGIFWWLNRNKYPLQKNGSNWGLYILGWMSQCFWLRLPYLLGYGILIVLFARSSTLAENIWLYSMPLALQICHYHLDAHLWKFSNPFIRNTVLKYLKD